MTNPEPTPTNATPLADGAPLLEAHDISKVFGRSSGRSGTRHAAFRAVDQVSFTLNAGGSLGLAGESGSGKTTLARIIAGAERATGGTLLVEGSPIDPRAFDRKQRRRYGRLVQMVYQDPYLSLDPHQTVGDCLAEILRFQGGMSQSQRKVRVGELLDMVGLGRQHANSLPAALSGGQRQRVAIARAMASDPRVLILDEAVSALDVSVQGQILNLLADLLAQTSISYIFISHNLAVIRQVCDYVIVMQAGRVVEEGPSAEVLSAPRAAYTQDLLACIPRPGWKPPRRASMLAGPAEQTS